MGEVEKFKSTFSNMKIAITIPWRSTKEREYPKKVVEDWYKLKFPEHHICFVDNKEYVDFNRAATRNLCVKNHLDYDVIIINDADTIPDYKGLTNAIEHCQYSGRVHLPYDKYYSLTEKGVEEFKEGKRINFCESKIIHNAISGVLVLSPDTWEKHNGQDENFLGWGFEDAAWYMAHTTLIGKPVNHFGSIYSFPQKGNKKNTDQYYENGKRVFFYEQSKGNYIDMYNLVFNNKIPDNV